MKDALGKRRPDNYEGLKHYFEHLLYYFFGAFFYFYYIKTLLRTADELSIRSSTGALGKSQPDNYEGLKHGKITVEGDKGVTIEGLQVF